MAMIAMFWIGLFYLLGRSPRHAGRPAGSAAPSTCLLSLCSRLLELVTMIASIRRQLSLEQTNLRFDTALENMTHGLCMFDAR